MSGIGGGMPSGWERPCPCNQERTPRKYNYDTLAKGADTELLILGIIFVVCLIALILLIVGVVL